MILRRSLRAVHRWLGAALCLLFLSWFASGIVMTFAGFPAVRERERLAHAAPLRAAEVRIQPAALADVAPDVEAIELVAFGERPIYRFRSSTRTTVVFADSGTRASSFDEGTVIASVSNWLRGPITERARLEDVDQWTLQAGHHGQLPLLRLAVGDEARTELYVSLKSGEIVQRTTARSRFLAWIGAIPHWIYPLQLRRHAGAWRTLVLILAAFGAITSASGLVYGFQISRVARRSARGERLSLTPFRDRWLAWHHRLGLAFGVLSFTWVLSGMLSFYPFASDADSDPSAVDIARFRGAALDPRAFDRDLEEALDKCRASLGSAIKRVEFTVAGGAPFYVCEDGEGGSRILSAHTISPPVAGLEATRMAELVRVLGAGAAVESEALLNEGDAYYYPTHFEPDLAFPIWRTRFDSGLVTYVSPRTLHIERRYTSTGAAYRWLYHGFHSLDFPWLYRRPRLWHCVILLALFGASCLIVSGVWLGIRWSSGGSRRTPRASRPSRAFQEIDTR